MDVVLVAPASKNTIGYSRYAQGLAGGLAEIGVRTRVVAVPKTEVVVGGRRFFGHVLTRARLTTTHRVRASADEIVHATEPLLVGPHVDCVTIHDAIPFKFAYSGIRERINGAYVRQQVRRLRGHRVAVPTQHVASDLVGLGFAADRIHVTLLGVDRDAFHPVEAHPHFDAPGFHVLMVGDLNPRKLWELVLDAAVDMDDVHVWHAGGGADVYPERAATVAHHAAALGPRYHRLDHVDDASLRALYSGCDLFCLPSADEGFGLPPLEAMACGAPVLVTDIPVFHEVLGDHADYAPLTTAGFRDGLGRAREGRTVSDPDARARHAASYTWSRSARETLTMYEAVRGRRAAR